MARKKPKQQKTQPVQEAKRQTPPWFRPYVYYVFILVVIAFVFAVRFRLRQTPLERDEGEYAYIGQLILQGIPPYKIAYNMKLPGTYVSYALIMAVLGQTPAGIHMGLLLINVATLLMIYLLACRLSGSVAGVVAAATYALLSLSPSVLGFAGHATHFVVLAACTGALLLLKAHETQRSLWLFLSGLLFGLAFIMKQPGVMFIVFAAAYVLVTEWTAKPRWPALGKKLGILGLGAVLPYAITCFALLRAHVFSAFWFWTVSYAAQYASQVPLNQGAERFFDAFNDVAAPAVWLWLLAGVGLTALFWDRKSRCNSFFTLAFLLFSFLALCPGLLFRQHYFILLLPAVSMLVGVGVSATRRALSIHSTTWLVPAIPIAAFLLALFASIYQQRAFLFELDPTAVCRTVYGSNPFPEAIPIADYISQHSSPNARIAVLGSEPEIYFYAHRHSATGFIYTYGLMEDQKYASDMQRQMIDEIEKTQPDYLVFVRVPVSWLVHPHSDTQIFTWAENYTKEHYEYAGIADILPNSTEYRWGDPAKSYRPRSQFSVLLFKRKST
jgi:hypothetical protein